MSISQQPPPSVIFEDLGPVKLEGRRFFPSLSSLSTFNNPLIGIPIAQRLILGFLIPALIAALAASIIGIQSAQLLDQESSFYQNLFQSYSSLTAGNNYLQLMNFKLNVTLSDAVANLPQAQLTADQQAVQGLETRYNTLLQNYIQHDLLINNPSQTALFNGAGHAGQDTQQNLLASSAMRTWQLYSSTQDQLLQDVQNGLYQRAQMLEQQQGQLTYSDALSALSQLIQFNGRLTTYVQDATNVQQTSTLVTTLIAVLLVFSAIGLIGWLIYGTLVSRLHKLQKVAQAVRRGDVDTRATVDGRDEITDVSISVNTMLDAMVGLLEQTRVQRDALVGAAERLFADMRLANGGEFDVKTAVNNDPIWMLSHAFNFTIGRFRRFVLRNQTTIEQLEVVSQQGMENANTFLTNARRLLPNPVSFSLSPPSSPGNALRVSGSGVIAGGNADLSNQIIGVRDQLQQFARQNVEPLGDGLLNLLGQASQLCQQVLAGQLSRSATPDHNIIQGVRSLEGLIGYLTTIVQSFQKNTARDLAEVYSNINQLAATASSASVQNIQNTTGASIGLTLTQAQELARLSEGFAREVTGLAQSLHRITEEMRASLAPFRLEVTQSSQPSLAGKSQQDLIGKNSQQYGLIGKSSQQENNRSSGF
jgi:methyl-accepting chemotaxis protein